MPVNGCYFVTCRRLMAVNSLLAKITLPKNLPIGRTWVSAERSFGWSLRSVGRSFWQSLGRSLGRSFGEVFGLVLLRYSVQNKNFKSFTSPKMALHRKAGENSSKNFMTRLCKGDPHQAWMTCLNLPGSISGNLWQAWLTYGPPDRI